LPTASKYRVISRSCKNVQYRAQQVRALGRPDASVRKVAFKPQVAIEKAWTPTQCSTALFGNQIVIIKRENLDSLIMCTANRPNIPQGSCLDWIQTTRHRAGVCNNSATVAMLGSASILPEGSTWATTTTLVAGNHAQLWIGTPLLNYELTKHRRSKMKLTAYASYDGTFHARLADY
jgi:hypothetical protein